MIVEIVILAMVAAFLGLRLYSVLGRRAEHEEEALGQVSRPGEPRAPALARDTVPGAPDPARSGFDRALEGVPLGAQRAVREIAAADRRFDPAGFLQGARAAYGMILEAFWRGDRESLDALCDDDVYAGFLAAIEAREASGQTVENRLVRINDARIVAADYDSPMARITVHFDADIAALTRDSDGNMIAGSLDDAVETHDVWTFSRRLNAERPDWLLDETDED